MGVPVWALLIVGGERALDSLQTGAIAAGLPVALILCLPCFSLMRALGRELSVEGARLSWGPASGREEC